MADKTVSVFDTTTQTYVPLRVVDLGDGAYGLRTSAPGQGSGADVAVSGAANLMANADNSYTFASQVRHVYVLNKSATDIYIERDAAASLGSSTIFANGGWAILDAPCTILHVWSTATTPVNGTAGANIVVKGWA